MNGWSDLQVVGIKPLLLLFRKVVTLLCRPEVAGGFDAGWRLMGIDGVSFTAPVTPGNIRACGLPKGGDTAQRTGGFPLVSKGAGIACRVRLCVALSGPGEPTIARRLVKHLTPEMLVRVCLRKVVESHHEGSVKNRIRRRSASCGRRGGDRINRIHRMDFRQPTWGKN